MVVVIHRIRQFHRGHLVHQVQHVHFFAAGRRFIQLFIIGVLQKVHVREVAEISVRHKEILPAIVVQICQQWRPAPVGCCHPGHHTDITESTVGPVQLEGISHELVVETIVNGQLISIKFERAFEHLLALVGSRQHIGHDQI